MWSDVVCLTDQLTSNFLKVFHKFYLVHSWIPWPKLTLVFWRVDIVRITINILYNLSCFWYLQYMHTSPTFVDDKNPAVVITIYETSITCCNSGAFVSAGLFQKFCLRFSDDFDYTAETWKIDDYDIMNTCEFISVT